MPPAQSSVFNKETPEEDQQHLLEQYKLYVESANLTSTLRGQANTFFLSVNTLLIMFVAGILEFVAQEKTPFWIVFACFAGLLLCISWYLILRSYRSLNSGRFAVIQEIEARLPARIYGREWEIVLKRRDTSYIRLSRIEQAIPSVFGLLYVALILSIVAVR